MRDAVHDVTTALRAKVAALVGAGMVALPSGWSVQLAGRAGRELLIVVLPGARLFATLGAEPSFGLIRDDGPLVVAGDGFARSVLRRVVEELARRDSE